MLVLLCSFGPGCLVFRLLIVIIFLRRRLLRCGPVLHGEFPRSYSHGFGSSLGIFPVDLVEVSHELEVSLRDRLEVTDGEVYLGGLLNSAFSLASGFFWCTPCRMLCVVLSQRKRCLTCVADLPPVPSHLLVSPPIVHGPGENLVVFDFDLNPSFFDALLDIAKIEIEDLPG